jgi:hypothetical protein
VVAALLLLVFLLLAVLGAVALAAFAAMLGLMGLLAWAGVRVLWAFGLVLAALLATAFSGPPNERGRLAAPPFGGSD